MPGGQRTLKPSAGFTPRSASGLALWLDASATDSMFTSPDGKVEPIDPSRLLDTHRPTLWFRADAAVGFGVIINGSNRVTTWYDEIDGEVSNPPSGFTGPLRIANAQNGLPLFRFDGSSGLIGTFENPLNTFLAGRERTYFIVCRTNVGTNNNARVFSVTPSSGADYSGVIPCMQQANSNVSLTPYNISASPDNLSPVSGANALCVYSCTITTNGANASVTARINGLPGTTTTSALATTDIKWGIGCDPSGANRYTGDIAEVIAFGEAITPTVRASIEKYLSNKWGIPGVHSPISKELSAITSPTEIGGLQLWADATDFTAAQNNTAISQWNDKSGYGRHFTQSDSTKRPVLQYTANNGKPALYFDPYDWMLSPASPKNDLVGASVGSPTICISTVCWQDTLAAGGSIAFGQSVAGGAGLSPERLVYYALYGNTSTIADIGGVSGGRISFANPESLYLTPIVITLYRNGATMQVRRNGVVLGELTNATANFASATTATQFTIGKAEASTYGGAYFSEMVAYSSGLTPTDVSRIEAYLAKKWNISGVVPPTPAVAHIADKSGKGRNATQATAAARPIVSSVLQNSKTQLAFDGSNDLMTLGNLSAAFPTAAELFVVMNNLGDNAYEVYATSSPMSGGDSNSAFGSYSFAGAFHITREGITPVTWIPYGDRTFLWNLRSSGLGHALGVDNITQYSNTTTGNYAGGTSHVLGASSATATSVNSLLGGRVMEVIAYNRVLSADQRSKVAYSLAGKWGFSLPPQVSNVEAQDWITRVYQNGGQVSASTALAVSNFADAINAVSGLRSKFIRLNLCCGDSIAAATVPLYRSTSYGGAVIGNSVDTPNYWVSSDYSEANGFQATATGNETNSSKYLACGTVISALPAFNNAHLAFDFKMISGASGVQQQLGQVFADGVGAEVNLTQYRMSFNTSNTLESVAGGTALINRTISTGQRLFCVTSRQNSSLVSTYLNGGSKLTDSTFIANRTLNASASLGIFAAWNGGYSPSFRHIISAYSFGSGLSDPDVTAYSSAMATFKAAVGRT